MSGDSPKMAPATWGSDEEGLHFVPLGGVGEIGMNVYLYGLGGRWMMVDLGLTFPDERLPGVEIVLPDISFAEQLGDELEGLILTHAHEDHLGAMPHLWPRLRCPVWCTPFTAAVLKRKLAEENIDTRDLIRVIDDGRTFEIGPFSCRFIHVTHSIPEAAALVIDTPYGKIFHSGDWKLDPMPMVGPKTDAQALAKLGSENVLAMLCDSTNILAPGTSGSEAEVRDSLIALMTSLPNRVVFTTFASNIARLETAIIAGHRAGREVCIVGRSMRRMLEAAREVGYLKDLPPLIDERDAASLPRGKVFYLTTGSQGESRAALSRIATGQHPRVRLEPGDTAIFSSKIIPGNERVLYNLHNLLVTAGVEVITEEDHFIHVSGHPCRDEVEQMYKWVRPKIAIPIHGEARHLSAHGRLALKMGVEQALVIRNGDVVQLAPGPAAVVDEVPVGRRVKESMELVDAEDDLFRQRRRLSSHGTIFVSIVLDGFGSVLTTPGLTGLGVVDGERFERLRGTLGDAITRAVEQLDDRLIMDDGRVADTVRTAVRQGLDLSRERRPLIEVQITRLTQDVLDQLEEETAAR
jgi:ribonuclease J